MEVGKLYKIKKDYILYAIDSLTGKNVEIVSEIFLILSCKKIHKCISFIILFNNIKYYMLLNDIDIIKCELVL